MLKYAVIIICFSILCCSHRFNAEEPINISSILRYYHFSILKIFKNMLFF